MNKRTFVLAILDGWGIGSHNRGNPIYIANPDNINYIKNNFPISAIQASGIAVGLPWDAVGNSEVGHLTIGAGKTLYQHLPKISISIDNGSFFKNPALQNGFNHALKNQSAVHLIGLLTNGNVHASLKHLIALIEMAKQQKCQKLYLHLFSDGQDSSPRSVLDHWTKLEQEINKNKLGILASLSGRYYAMDRDQHWDRTEKAYQALIGEGVKNNNLKAIVQKAYNRDLKDQFIEPTVIDNTAGIKDGDTIIFFNFREDSMRQIAESFINSQFQKFATKSFKDISIITMTQYSEEFKVPVAFPKEIMTDSLGKVLADNDKIQLRIAETLKYAHVTYFFNSLQEKPFPNEYRVLIPSHQVTHPDEHPEMMASAITDRALAALNEGGFDFILINYANPDVIAHTSNYDATIEAIKVVDQEIGRLVKSVLSQKHLLIITADHGNAETLIDIRTGKAESQHNDNPVPFYLIADEFKRQKSEQEVLHSEKNTIGLLSDVAPTILELMKIPKPKEMTGQSLLSQLI